MEKIVDIFLSWEILLISISVFVVQTVIKRVGTRKDGKKVVGGFAHSKIYKTIQPIVPYPIAVGLVFIPGVPLPEAMTETVAVKVLVALVAAFFADKAYQLVKGGLEKAGVKFPEKE